jgi:cytochrome c
MDSFELNKIIGAILGTLLFVMGVGFLAEGIYAPIANVGPSYDLPEPAAGASATAATAPAVPLATLLATADASEGASSAKKCQSCHDFTEGGPNKTGPNLYDVVGRKIAGHPGFSYSDVLKSHEADTWSYDELNKWLASPKGLMPGTKMTFVGIDDPVERANVLAYLRTLSHNPVPFPVAEAAKPAAAAPAAATPAPATTTAAPAAAATAPAATPAPAATTPAPAATTAAPAATTATPATTTTPAN